MPLGSEQTNKKKSGTKISQLPTAIECEVQFNSVYSFAIEYFTPSTLLTMKQAPLCSKSDICHPEKPQPKNPMFWELQVLGFQYQRFEAEKELEFFIPYF